MKEEKKKVHLAGEIVLHFENEVEVTRKQWEKIKERSEKRSPQPLTDTFYEADLGTETDNAYDITEELDECWSDWEEEGEG